MALAVSHKPLTAEAGFRSQAGRCEILEHKVAMGQVYHRVLSFCRVSVSPVVPHTHVCVHAAVAWSAKGQGWEPSKKECTFGNRVAFDRELFQVAFKGLI